MARISKIMKRSRSSKWAKSHASTSHRTAVNSNVSNPTFHSKTEKIQGKVLKRQGTETSKNRIREASSKTPRAKTISRKLSNRRAKRVQSIRNGRRITPRYKTLEPWLVANTRKSKK